MKKQLTNVSQHCGNGVVYFNGGKEKFISNSMLKQIQSSVQTHEGETLHGKAARNYMDKYSKKYLGKDLAGSYNNTKLTGHV